MKAFYYPAFETLDIREVPVPEPAKGEVLLRVAACGLCGSELETFKNRNPRRTPPLIMGHEFCGTVTKTGAGVTESLEGRRFVSNSVVSCRTCVRCRRGDTHLCHERQIFGMHRPGAFTEFVSVPMESLIPWPDELPAEAASLAEPLANGVHCVNLTRHVPVEKALVIGAGPIGLMCQQALQAMRGAQVMVCDLSSGRLAIAAKLGAAKIVSSKDGDVAAEALAWTDGEGVDLVIDAAGAAATKRLSLAALRPGGATVWIGLHSNRIEIDSYDITLPEKQVLGTYAAKQEELALALDLMRTGKVDVTSWTEKAPLDQSVEIFNRMLNPTDRDLKAVIIP
jgi:threonine dehydrogenase-like Zn-dependent dehydrogenase